MKYLFLTLPVLAIMAAVAPAMENNSVVTTDSVQSTMTVSGIAISSAPATSVVINLKALYRQVCVQNLDTLNFLSCGETVNVSTITSSGFAGVVISTKIAGAGMEPRCFEVVAGNDFFCRSSSVTGSSRAVIVRKR